MRRVVVLAALVVPTTASAHFKLVAPESEYVQSSLGDPQKTFPCGPTGAAVGSQKRLAYVVPATGTYYLEVRFVPPARGRVTYTLSVATTGAG